MFQAESPRYYNQGYSAGYGQGTAVAIGTKAVRISTIRAAYSHYPQYPRNLPPRYQSQLPPQYYDRHRGFERRDHWRQEHRHQRPRHS